MKLFEKEEKTEKLLERLTKLESLPSTKEALASEKAEILAKRQARRRRRLRPSRGDTATVDQAGKGNWHYGRPPEDFGPEAEGLARVLNEKKSRAYEIQT